MFRITDDMKNLATAFGQVGLIANFRESSFRRYGHTYSFMMLEVHDGYGNKVNTIRFNTKGEYIVSWEFADVVDGKVVVK